MEKVKVFLKYLYHKLAGINDTPHKVALGFAVGVLLGILPGVGPLASLAAAFILKVNRAAALLGSLLTNTWFSIVTFVVSVKVGAFLTGKSWQGIQEKWEGLIKNFRWEDLFQQSILDIIFPVMIGYLMIGLCAALVAYSAALGIMLRKREV